jgi:hypothetical protein
MRRSSLPAACRPHDERTAPRQKSHITLAKMAKTYNSGYSPVVTHLTTNPPVSCLNIAERTGSIAFRILWSYVQELGTIIIIYMVVYTASLRETLLILE